MGRVGARPILSKFDGPGRAAAHEMWALYGPLRAERSMWRPMCYDGPTRTAAHEMWCATATITTTSTVPMRPPTCFDGPARAVTHEMWYTTATTTTLLGVPGSLFAQNSYVRTMHFWQIASSV